MILSFTADFNWPVIPISNPSLPPYSMIIINWLGCPSHRVTKIGQRNWVEIGHHRLFISMLIVTVKIQIWSPFGHGIWERFSNTPPSIGDEYDDCPEIAILVMTSQPEWNEDHLPWIEKPPTFTHHYQIDKCFIRRANVVYPCRTELTNSYRTKASFTVSCGNRSVEQKQPQNVIRNK